MKLLQDIKTYLSNDDIGKIKEFTYQLYLDWAENPESPPNLYSFSESFTKDKTYYKDITIDVRQIGPHSLVDFSLTVLPQELKYNKDILSLCFTLYIIEEGFLCWQ